MENNDLGDEKNDLGSGRLGRNDLGREENDLGLVKNDLGPRSFFQAAGGKSDISKGQKCR